LVLFVYIYAVNMIAESKKIAAEAAIFNQGLD